jgi:peptidoglycan/xylan/chitin deacetylase (PgdA/CDA1 family)
VATVIAVTTGCHDSLPIFAVLLGLLRSGSGEEFLLAKAQFWLFALLPWIQRFEKTGNIGAGTPFTNSVSSSVTGLSMLKIPFTLASPGGARGRLNILIFHHVLPARDSLFPDVSCAVEFERHMLWVRSWFNVLPLRSAIDQLYAGTIPRRALAITFDDGYSDNEAIAAPILKRLGLTATFFVATGFIGKGCMFNDRVIEAVRMCRAERLNLTSFGLEDYRLGTGEDRRFAIASILKEIGHREPSARAAIADAIATKAGDLGTPAMMMNPDQIRNLRALGMDIGGHTVSHPILTRLSTGAAFEEMKQGKTELEAILKAPVDVFAYPNGVPVQDYVAEHARMAKECGFVAAVTTAWGAATRRTDRYQLPRFTPWGRTKFRWGARLLANFRVPARGAKASSSA